MIGKTRSLLNTLKMDSMFFYGTFFLRLILMCSSTYSRVFHPFFSNDNDLTNCENDQNVYSQLLQSFIFLD